VWITYAWDDNEDRDVDFIAHELRGAGQRRLRLPDVSEIALNNSWIFRLTVIGLLDYRATRKTINPMMEALRPRRNLCRWSYRIV